MPPATLSATTTITPCHPSLSANDTAVLQALFDGGESTPSATAAVTVDTSLPPLPDISLEDFTKIQAREVAAIQAVQDKTKNATISNGTTSPIASDGTTQSYSEESEAAVEAAITELNALIIQHPTYPSAYVNRAQARRLMLDAKNPTGNHHDLKPDPSASTASTVNKTGGGLDSSQQEEHGDTNLVALTITELIFADLSKAIHLSQPSSPLALSAMATSDSISPFRARVLADAHTFRGYLLLRASKTDSSPSSIQHLGKDALEEMASRDFFAAGQYGNPVAKALAVQTNPYAKMCGAIVKEALRKEVEGENV